MIDTGSAAVYLFLCITLRQQDYAPAHGRNRAFCFAGNRNVHNPQS
jgi:hypothetical protein